MLFNPFSSVLPIRTRIFAGAGLALLLACVALALRGNHYRADRDAWRAAHHAQKAAMIAAQQVAATKAETQRLATENRYAQLARRADDDEKSARTASVRAAADRFAAARQLRPEAACRLSGPAPAAAAHRIAPDRDRSGADAVDDARNDANSRVVLTRDEYAMLEANTFRLERVRQWGQSLIDDGLAVEAGNQ